jgi:hypothetical protein
VHPAQSHVTKPLPHIANRQKKGAKQAIPFGCCPELLAQENTGLVARR